MTPAVAPRQNGARAYGVALAVSVAQLVIMGTFVSYPVFLTPMGDDATLGRPSQTSLSIAQSVAMGVSAVLSVVAGWLCDRFGTRPVVASAGLSLGAALLLTPLAHSMAALFLCYGGCMGIAVAASDRRDCAGVRWLRIGGMGVVVRGDV